MVICALGTIALGIVLVWALIRPGVIQSVGTAELAGVAGALLAPCLALFALRFDTRIARRDQLEAIIEAKVRSAGPSSARNLIQEGRLHAEAPKPHAEADAATSPDQAVVDDELIEEISPVIARIFHEGDVQRVETRHTPRPTPGPRVTAG